MARAAALIYPTFGHITPALAVVAELVRRGDDVVFYGTGRSRARIERTGAAFRAYAQRHDAFSPIPPTDGLFSDMARLLALSEELLPRLLDEIAATRLDYVILDTKSLWGRLVAQTLGLRAVTLSVVFAIKPGLIGAGELADRLYGQGPPDRLRAGLRALGAYFDTARRVDRAFGTTSPDIIAFLGNPQPLNIIFTSRAFQLQGDAFGDDFVFVGTSIADADWQESGADPVFDGIGEGPLVYVSLGTTFNDAPGVYRACFEASVGAPWQMLISTGGAPGEPLGEPPPNVHVRQFVPQLRVLARADVFVTHGGMNSANEAQHFGVPMVVVPQRGDQYLVGARVADLGAGVWLPPTAVTAPRLRDSVTTVLRGAPYREAAARLRDGIRSAGGFRRAADAIQDYVRAPA